MRLLIFYLIFPLLIDSCVNGSVKQECVTIEPGAEQTQLYLPLLLKKNVAVVANNTSLIGHTHLVDSLLSLDVSVKKIFNPEHGFRGQAEAGEFVKDYVDEKTGLPVISLYGSSKKPDIKDLEGVDIVVFDLQDVGVRFYTYISTMHYVMEACAEANIEMLVLDRPNPNGFYVDGPVLDMKYQSFVGMHPVPIVHGMTIAEYARMVNGEGWLANGIKCQLSYIPCKNYTHDSLYKLPVSPSPNLENMLSVYLYPSLGLFEGTSISVGRGTDFPFQVFGSPGLRNVEFSFTPRSIAGVSNNPMYMGEECVGVDLRSIDVKSFVKQHKINLEWILFGFNNAENKDDFFNSFFYNISGVSELKQRIIQGKSAEEIRNEWESGLREFRAIRKKYLIYKDFENNKP